MGLCASCCGESAEARRAREEEETREAQEARSRAADAAQARQAAFDKTAHGRAAKAASQKPTYGATAQEKRDAEVVAGWQS